MHQSDTGHSERRTETETHSIHENLSLRRYEAYTAGNPKPAVLWFQYVPTPTHDSPFQASGARSKLEPTLHIEPLAP